MSTSEQEFRKLVGERIKARRKALSLTLQQVATELGVSNQTVQEYEAGKSWPGPEKFFRLRQKLETTSAYLFGEVEDPSPEIFSQINGFRDPEIRSVAATLHSLDARIAELGTVEVPEKLRQAISAYMGVPALAQHPTPEKHAAKRDAADTVAKDRARTRKRAERDAKKPKPEAPEDPFKFR